MSCRKVAMKFPSKVFVSNGTTPWRLTIRSSRRRLVARFWAFRYASPKPRHCSARLNSSVRLGKKQHLLLGWLDTPLETIFRGALLASDAITSVGFCSPPVLVLPLRNAPNYSCSLIFKRCAQVFRNATFLLAALAASAARASASH